MCEIKHKKTQTSVFQIFEQGREIMFSLCNTMRSGVDRWALETLNGGPSEGGT